MDEKGRVKGVYAHLDALLTGIDRLKKAGYRGFDVMSPMPRHEIAEIMYEGKPSPVRWWTLTGAITGINFGFLLPALTHSQWPMINPGGKPTVSLPPFVVIMFECTVLFGSYFNLLGLIVHCGLPSFWLDKSIQDPRFTDDKFGIVFTDASEEDRQVIRKILEETGAIEVTELSDTIYEVQNA